MKIRTKLSLTAIILLLLLGFVIALESFQNFISGANVGSLNFTIVDVFAPNITLLSPADAASFSEGSVTFEYMVDDKSDISNCSLILNSAVDQTDTTITKNTTQSFLKSMSAGSHTWAVNCTDSWDNEGNSSTRSLTVTAVAVAVAPAAAAPGGAGLTKPSGSYQFYYPEINPDSPLPIFISDTGTGLVKLTISVYERVQNPTIRVLGDAKLPPDVPLPAKLVYQYYDISILPSSKIKSITIQFRIPKSWIVSNLVDPKSIKLTHYSNGKWIEQPTVQDSEDLNNLYFTSSIPGSFVAVVAKSLEEAAAPALPTEMFCGNGVCDVGESQTGCCSDCGCPEDQECIQNTCQAIPICGNNICEADETVTCASDCPKVVAFRPVLIIVIIMLITILTIAGVATLAKEFETKEAQQLSKYATRVLAKGHKMADVKKALIAAGWDPHLVNRVLIASSFKKIFHRVKKR